ncbi:hypothetical protein DMUE_5891, partial [Dictyocoela muelleri]
THHNHLQNISNNKAKLILNQIKERSLSTSESSRDIIVKVLKNEKVGADISYTAKYMTEQVNKTRRSKNFTYKEDNSLPEEIKVTETGVKFLQYNSGIEERSRFIIFGTESNIIQLENATLWIIYETFKIAPVGFTQVLTIQIMKNETFIPVVFILMTKKDLCLYEPVFYKLKTMITKIISRRIIMDFEQTLILLCVQYLQQPN